MEEISNRSSEVKRWTIRNSGSGLIGHREGKDPGEWVSFHAYQALEARLRKALAEQQAARIAEMEKALREAREHVSDISGCVKAYGFDHEKGSYATALTLIDAALSAVEQPATE